MNIDSQTNIVKKKGKKHNQEEKNFAFNYITYFRETNLFSFQYLKNKNISWSYFT